MALTVAQLGVVELVVGNAVLVLHDRQRLERLAEEGEFLSVYANLACLGTEHKTLDADEVTDVKEFLEYRVVEFFVVTRAEVVAGDVHLDTYFGVQQLYERRLTYNAAAHHSSCYADLAFLVVLELVYDVC